MFVEWGLGGGSKKSKLFFIFNIFASKMDTKNIWAVRFSQLKTAVIFAGA